MRAAIFSLNLVCQSLDIMISYHHVQYQKKLMIQSWEKLVTEGQRHKQADKQTVRQTDVG